MMMLKVRHAKAHFCSCKILRDMRIKQIVEQWVTGILVAKKTGNFPFLFYHASPRREYWFNEMSE